MFRKLPCMWVSAEVCALALIWLCVIDVVEPRTMPMAGVGHRPARSLSRGQDRVGNSVLKHNKVTWRLRHNSHSNLQEKDSDVYTPESKQGIESKQKWNYVKVREHAFMFWWLYFTTATEGYMNKPLVLWLQGGPGGSSTGFGNFQEIGPLDVTLTPRKTTWLGETSLLFVDNPVGTGYSYVTDDQAYTQDVHGIAVDLLTLIKSFLEEVPDFQIVPLYIFSESYGGKMTAAFSQILYQAIKAGSLKCRFEGFAMGDSWISPVDSVLTWGPYLYATSLVDEKGLSKVNKPALASQKATEEGKWKEATNLWGQAEDVIMNVTNGVNLYNILDWNGLGVLRTKMAMASSSLERSFLRHVGVMMDDPLTDLMNGPIRRKLKIIPTNVTWGGQAGRVFDTQRIDFMKPVIDIVDAMLRESDIKVVVYSGQLDLIVDTIGTEKWVQKLKWPGLDRYNAAPRRPLVVNEQTAGFVKEYENFSFYWILDAGHMIPADAGDTALAMLRQVIGGKTRP